MGTKAILTQYLADKYKLPLSKDYIIFGIRGAKPDGDGNDLTDTLQDLTKLTIPYSSGNVTYDILNITRYSTYFMYYVENPSIDFADRDDIEYIFTGSFEDEGITITNSRLPAST